MIGEILSKVFEPYPHIRPTARHHRARVFKSRDRVWEWECPHHLFSSHVQSFNTWKEAWDGIIRHGVYVHGWFRA